MKDFLPANIAKAESSFLWKSLSKVWTLLLGNLVWPVGDGDGSWNLNFLQTLLLEDIISYIIGIPPPHPAEGSDRLSWRHTSSGAFSVRTAHKMLKENS
ncbi:hypothetical protein V6Z12_A07G128700 [Gossypium hirsutum]